MTLLLISEHRLHYQWIYVRCRRVLIASARYQWADRLPVQESCISVQGGCLPTPRWRVGIHQQTSASEKRAILYQIKYTK